MSAFEPAAEAAALDALLERLHEPSVRDLAWLLLSPSLLRPQPPLGMLAEPFDSPADAAASVAWLLTLERDPAPLRECLAASRFTRLGRYAECLLAFFLEHGPSLRLVAANVALRRAGRTLGECDFLIRTPDGFRLHWELAVKCYLHAGGTDASLADYVGPSLQDRFDLKLAHLVEHQLPLSARDEFASLGHAGPWDARMFVKGWLFYRWNEASGGLELPPMPAAIDPRHARGFWLERTALPRFAAGRADAWAVLPRLAWLAPRSERAVQAGEFVSADALAARLASQSGPTMVAAFSRCASGDPWIEQARGFVVPDGWPRAAAVFARQSYHQR
jgi:hypothetical protein